MAKTMLVLFLSALMISSLFTQHVEAKEIGYGAMGRDRGPGCSPTHPENCKDKPANPYTRGCEKENKCRGGAAAEN
ncbi:protein RALF-like 16-like [Trifolium pratense]|uniref:Protein RALF-like 16-like n=1 Tax=Trifolium pratense TaxID=57577 RepID=A0A2K3LHF9_TRIPR|nr:protein RALF-like 16-like [Trifolium pratense]